MRMQKTPGPPRGHAPARMSQGRLIVTIAAGIVLAVVGLAVLPFLFIGGVAVLGYVLHLFIILLPLIIGSAVIWAIVRWLRSRA
jgi:uncharacterized membrane protein YeaQ/YmgE (transglycosylase-associated protein family)